MVTFAVGAWVSLTPKVAEPSSATSSSLPPVGPGSSPPPSKPTPLQRGPSVRRSGTCWLADQVRPVLLQVATVLPDE